LKPPSEEKSMAMKGMAWVRILVGTVWLDGALEKLLNPHFPKQFALSLKAGGFIAQAPPFFRAFMERVVSPDPEAIAQIVRFVELSLGVALVLGLVTNLAALGSLAQSLAIMFSQGGVAFGTRLGAPEFLNVDLVMAMLSVIILLSPEAKTFSVDAVLARRNPALPTLLTNRSKQLE
jgi:thiosulfate dehydrogenase [quinone] large subunit